MSPGMAPPVLNRRDCKLGCRHICSFAADAIPPKGRGLSFPVDRLSAALVGRDAVRAKARNFHFSSFGDVGDTSVTVINIISKPFIGINDALLCAIAAHRATLALQLLTLRRGDYNTQIAQQSLTT
jgi:hypothetical protein